MSDKRTQADREFDWSTGREIERKDAEIARLRATLEQIIEIEQFTVKIDGVFVEKRDGRTASIARAALQQTPGA